MKKLDDSSTLRDIGGRIARIRKSRELTQGQLAGRIGVAFQYLSKWERGLKNPSATNVIRIADALGVTPDDILTDKY